MKLFEHINYEGVQLDIAADTPDLRVHGAQWNDQASSVRVDPGTTVELYQDINYGGQQLSLTSDAPDLRAFPGPGRDGTWNDAASSVKIAGGGAGVGSERLMKGSLFVECNAGGTITTTSVKSDNSKVKITKHSDGHYDVLFTKANLTLSIEPDGRMVSRPAGTYAAFEQLDAITAPKPNVVSVIYRVADGSICGGNVLQIVEA